MWVMLTVDGHSTTDWQVLAPVKKIVGLVALLWELGRQWKNYRKEYCHHLWNDVNDDTKESKECTEVCWE